MLTESFIAATQAVNKQSAHTISSLKDVGVFQYEYQPQSIFRHGFKKSSIKCQCLAISDSHIFAAQSDKAVINVYSREKGNQEATVPFPERIHSLVYADTASVLIIGTEDGKLILWETATGRVSDSAVSHLEPVSQLALTRSQSKVVSGSSDSSVHAWSISALLAFQQSEIDQDGGHRSNSPILTYANHRAAITALAVSNSATDINFVVSASADLTCYVWHLETGQILRTIILPINTLSMILDPADRAIYFGCENGTIHHVDLLRKAAKGSKTSVFDTISSTPIQLYDEQGWRSSSIVVGAVQCMTLSYDGTSLISGHSGGPIMRWDVAKYRMVSELVKLDQPVTGITMLPPTGFPRNKPEVKISTVVKPKLEFNSDMYQSTMGIPSTYSLQLQITESGHPTPSEADEVSLALIRSNFPDTMLDDAIQAMLARSAGVTTTKATTTEDQASQYKLEALQEELSAERRKVARFQEEFEARRKKHERRQQVRDKLIARKIGIYRSASQDGMDGDAAIKVYHAIQEMIDRDSDDDILSRTTSNADGHI